LPPGSETAPSIVAKLLCADRSAQDAGKITVARKLIRLKHMTSTAAYHFAARREIIGKY
jgi:hypothetical protein